MFDLVPAEVRVLGCLVEKQRTTPDAYPLSLNALRAACNQATNRDPVVVYDEATIRDALQRLARRRWTRLASGAGSRAAKYRHLLDEALGLGDAELSVLAVLMLRGAQTPGELRSRTERLHAFADAGELTATLDRLAARELVQRLARRPGQKEERYAHLLSGTADAAEPTDPSPPPSPPAVAPAPPAPPALATDASGDGDRVAALEREIAELRDEVAALRADLGTLRADLGA